MLRRLNSDPFVTIPAATLPGGLHVPAFRVGQYVCTKGKDGKAIIKAEGKPWVNINYNEACMACLDSGASLITETQALALAYQVTLQPENWIGGQVGKGKLYQGLRQWNVTCAQPGTYEPKEPDERRWFALPDGQRIFDVAGNVYSWIFDDVQGDAQGLVAKPFVKDSPSLVIPYPNEERGQGWTPRTGANWSGDALIRGGCWGSGSRAGAFYLYSDWPGDRYDYVGFRCTKCI